MPVTDTTERRFEDDITGYLLSEGGYTRNADLYDPQLGLFPDTLIRFVRRTQPREWARFANMNAVNPERKFCAAFSNACDMDGVLYVL